MLEVSEIKSNFHYKTILNHFHIISCIVFQFKKIVFLKFLILNMINKLPELLAIEKVSIMPMLSIKFNLFSISTTLSTSNHGSNKNYLKMIFYRTRLLKNAHPSSHCLFCVYIWNQ